MIFNYRVMNILADIIQTMLGMPHCIGIIVPGKCYSQETKTMKLVKHWNSKCAMLGSESNISKAFGWTSRPTFKGIVPQNWVGSCFLNHHGSLSVTGHGEWFRKVISGVCCLNWCRRCQNMKARVVKYRTYSIHVRSGGDRQKQRTTGRKEITSSWLVRVKRKWSLWLEQTLT